jgi:hypothetical protein
LSGRDTLRVGLRGGGEKFYRIHVLTILTIPVRYKGPRASAFIRGGLIPIGVYFGSFITTKDTKSTKFLPAILSFAVGSDTPPFRARRFIMPYFVVFLVLFVVD